MKPECLSYFFGICIQSEEHAHDILFYWGIGSAAGLVLVALAFVAGFTEEWLEKRRQRLGEQSGP